MQREFTKAGILALMLLISVSSVSALTWENVSQVIAGIDAPLEDINGTIDEVRILNISLSPAEIYRNFLDQNVSNVSLSQNDFDAHSNYTSKVFDLGSGANFTDLKWTEEFGYGDSVGQDENATAVLILHMDDYVNGTGSNVSDSSGLGNNGTLFGGASMNCTKEGIMGYGCDFDGGDDYIVANYSSLNITGPLTVEAWVKVNNYDDQNTVVSKWLKTPNDRSFWLATIRDSGYPSFSVSNLGNDIESATVSMPIGIGEWHHLAGVYDGSNAHIYVDGTLANSTSTGASLYGTTAPLTIGGAWEADLSTLYEKFDGTIDEVSIWNRSLSASEIRDHYYRGAMNLTLQTRTGSYFESPNPRRVLSLHMEPDPTNASKVEDDSGLGNHGTITGAHFVEGKLGSALEFDGVDDYVNCGNDDSLDPATSFTYEAWFKIKGPGPDNRQNIIASGNNVAGAIGHYLYIKYSTLKPEIYLEGTTSLQVTSSTAVGLNEWHHLVSTKDENIVAKLYLDGVEVGNDSSISDNLAWHGIAVGALYIPTYIAPSMFFNGTIDEVNIYTYPMSVNEVRQLYESYNSTWSEWSGPDYTHSGDESMVLGLDFSEIEYPEHYPDDAALVGYWDFDGDDHTTNLTLDSSDYNNTGECYNMSGICNWTVGKVGAGMLFDGVDDWVNASGPDLGSTFSIELWFYARDTDESDNLINARNDYITVRFNSNDLCFAVWNATDYTTASSINNIDTGRWYHAVAVYEPEDSISLYLDGSLQQTAEMDTVGGSTTIFEIGARAYSGDRFFNGTIDEVAIYSRALNQSEIMRHYELGFKRIRDESAVYCDNCSRMHNNFAIFPSDLADVSSRLPAADPDLTAEGKHGSALVFDGEDDYVDVGQDASINFDDKDFSLSLWFYPASSQESADVALVDRQHTSGYRIQWESAGKVEFSLADDGGTQRRCWSDEGMGTMDSETWYHIGYVYDYSASTLHGYIDGAQVCTEPVTGTPAMTAFNLIIGAYAPDTTLENFNGSLDSVAIYNRTLSAAEVRDHANDRYSNSSGAMAGDQNRFFQYRVFMSTRDSNVTPKLNELKFTQTDFNITVLNALPSDGDLNLTGPANATWFTSQPDFNWTELADIDYNYLNMSDSGLVSYWTFDAQDKNDSHVYDVKGVNHGLITGGALCGNVTGRAGAGCQFDGVDDYVAVGDQDSLDFGTDDFTIGLWFKTELTSAAQFAIQKGATAASIPGYSLALDAAGNLDARIGNGSVRLDLADKLTNLNDGEWHHVVAVFDRDNEAIFYKDGSSGGTGDISSLDGTSVDTVVGFTISRSGTKKFNGTIDEVAIYNRTLSAAEIASHYRAEDMRYELLIANGSNFTSASVAFGGLLINNFSQPQYWDDEYTVLLEHFDSLAGIAANNGTVYGNFSICEGRFGTGGCFDGESAYIDARTSSDFDISVGLAVEAWVNIREVGGDILVLKRKDADNAWLLGLHAQEGFTFQVENAGAFHRTYVDSVPSLNQWYHVAGTYSSTENTRLFVDGAEITTKLTAESIGPGAGTSLVIGSRYGSDLWFNGTLDEVRISNVARIPVSDLPNSSVYALGGAYNISDSVNSSLYYWKVRPLNIDDRSEDDEQIYGDWSGARTFCLDTTDPAMHWTRPRSDNLSILGGWFWQNITAVDKNLFWMNCTIYNSTGYDMWNTSINLTGYTQYNMYNWTNISEWPYGVYTENCTVWDLTKKKTLV